MKRKPIIILAILIVVGALAGFVYWKTIGCASGTCPITSKWYWTTLYGAFFGYVVGDSINGYIRKKEAKNSN